MVQDMVAMPDKKLRIYDWCHPESHWR